MKQLASTKSILYIRGFIIYFNTAYDYILTIVSKGFANSVNRLISSGHLTRSLKGSENAGIVISNIFQRSGVGSNPIGAKSTFFTFLYKILIYSNKFFAIKKLFIGCITSLITALTAVSIWPNLATSPGFSGMYSILKNHRTVLNFT